jgi:hypothetical protein
MNNPLWAYYAGMLRISSEYLLLHYPSACCSIINLLIQVDSLFLVQILIQFIFHIISSDEISCTVSSDNQRL